VFLCPKQHGLPKPEARVGMPHHPAPAWCLENLSKSEVKLYRRSRTEGILARSRVPGDAFLQFSN
jgi:hypothetical protein